MPVFEWPVRHPARIGRPRSAPELRRVASVLAIARLTLACATVATSVLMPDVTGTDVVSFRTLSIVYAAQSAMIALLVHYRMSPSPTWGIVVHISDVIWAATLTAVTTGPNSPLYVLFLFCLLSAAYRWGLRETIATGVATLGLFAGEASVPLHAGLAAATRFPPHSVLMRATYLLMGAIVLGYVAEEEQLHHAESSVIGRVLAHIQAETGFRSALRHTIKEILDVFDAQRLLVVAVEPDSGRTVCWDTSRHQDQLVMTLDSGGELSEYHREALRFPAPGDAVRIARAQNNRARLLSLDSEGGLLGTNECELPARFWGPSAAATIVNVKFADHWTGRVIAFFDRPPGLAELRLMQRLVCNATPVMYSHYLLRRLRTRVAAIERLRVARELHDGVVQSLAGLEMHVAALRISRRDDLVAVRLDDELAKLQQLLAEEARAVRDVMHQIRPLDIRRGQIVRVFEDVVSRFERESGIDAQFVATIEAVELPPATARELGRTLQEALRNVRKHSGATRVDVTFSADRGKWTLTVENNGRPFDFTGKWTLDDLEAQLRGPRVIKERVRAMGGNLVIESQPGRGVRLEVSVPQVRRAYA